MGESSVARIRIDLKDYVHKMAYGIGQNWEVFDKPVYYPNTETLDTMGVSSFGAIPHHTDQRRWKQIFGHAQWLGINFIRLEIEQAMYMPEQYGLYDWDNNEIKNILQILDWCQEKEADVFLTEMWHRCKWNFPEHVVSTITQAPRDVNAWAEAFSGMVDYLVNEKGYTCIQCVCIGNEPNPVIAGWPDDAVKQGDDFSMADYYDRPDFNTANVIKGSWDNGATLDDGLNAVTAAFKKRKLQVPIAGPDYIFANKFMQDDRLGVYENHIYSITKDTPPLYLDWIAGARSEGKPFFIGEYGVHIPFVNTTYEKNLELAGWTLREANAGCDGFLRWNYMNRGALDGSWQMIDSYDPENDCLLENVTPHPNTYYIQGMLSRYLPKRATVVYSYSNMKYLDVAAFLGQDDNVTIIVVNNAQKDFDTNFDLAGMQPELKLYKYGLTPEIADQTDVEINPLALVEIAGDGKFTDRIQSGGIYVYSTYLLHNSDEGII